MTGTGVLPNHTMLLYVPSPSPSCPSSRLPARPFMADKGPVRHVRQSQREDRDDQHAEWLQSGYASRWATSAGRARECIGAT